VNLHKNLFGLNPEHCHTTRLQFEDTFKEVLVSLKSLEYCKKRTGLHPVWMTSS
jgi:hypothetical protein